MNSRLTAIRTTLSEEKLDACIISSVPHIIWLTAYTGFSPLERECYLLITQSKAYLFTDLRYSEAMKELVPHFITRETNSTNSFPKQLEEIARNEHLEHIGIESNNLTVDEFLKLNKTKLDFVSIDLSELRINKTPQEITAIQAACQIGDQTYDFICAQIKVGMTEKEIAKQMEAYIRKNNAELSFSTIVAFGENAATPHHLTSNRKLKSSDCILMDFGVKYENYCSDMTRTLFIGEASQEQRKAYETVLSAQRKAVSYIEKALDSKQHVEVSASDADKAARNVILEKDYPTIPHSLGHGIGLEVHEAPNLSSGSGYTLEEGMVFSIEPGIYLQKQFGIRIEDLYTIHKNMLIQLTHSNSVLTIVPSIT